MPQPLRKFSNLASSANPPQARLNEIIGHYRLLDYARRLRSGALTRWIGFLLELYKVAPSAKLEHLRRELTPTYHRLDPTLPKSGRFEARWRLQLNIDKSELEAIPHT